MSTDHLPERPAEVAERMREWLKRYELVVAPAVLEAAAIMEAALPHLIYRTPDRSDRGQLAIEKMREIAAISAGWDDASAALQRGDSADTPDRLRGASDADER